MAKGGTAMARTVITEQDLLAEEKVAQRRIQETAQSSKKGTGLNMPGLETVVIFIAVKVVVPIVSGFLSRVLYDKYSNIQTNSDAEKARKAILATEPQADTVDEKTMQEEVSKKLTEEGLPADLAKKIVSDTIQDVKTKYFSKN
jgi:hypothetical protein